MYISHPTPHTRPGITRNLIHGILRKYWIQKTHLHYFHRMTTLLFNRFLARGHSEATLHRIFLQSATTIDKTKYQKLLPTNTTQQTNPSLNEIFSRWLQRSEPGLSGIFAPEKPVPYKSTPST